MEDGIVIGVGDYRMRNGQRTHIFEPLRSGAARGLLDDGKTIHVWNAAGECLSGEREYDIVRREAI